jgi:hypothetical protein
MNGRHSGFGRTLLSIVCDWVGPGVDGAVEMEEEVSVHAVRANKTRTTQQQQQQREHKSNKSMWRGDEWRGNNKSRGASTLQHEWTTQKVAIASHQISVLPLPHMSNRPLPQLACMTGPVCQHSQQLQERVESANISNSSKTPRAIPGARSSLDEAARFPMSASPSQAIYAMQRMPTIPCKVDAYTT